MGIFASFKKDIKTLGSIRASWRFLKVRFVWFIKRRREDLFGIWNVRYQLSKKKVEEQFRQYVKEKRVVIIGPAPQIRGSRQAQKIDSYDVVVRLNTALPIPEDLKQDIGQRTDILYHVLDEESGRDIRPLIDEWGLQFIVNSYPDIRWYISNTLKIYKSRLRTPLRSLSKKIWNQVFCSVRSTPNTGLLAIAELLSSDIKELYITGFSFYKGGCDPSYRQESEKEYFERLKTTFYLSELFHDQAAQFDYFKNQVCSDPRVNLDSFMRNLCG